jgi:hypothetical protein
MPPGGRHDPSRPSQVVELPKVMIESEPEPPKA